MKLGLISDIHADYTSLTTVLHRLRNIHQVDQILCAGDLTGYGNQSGEVLALFREERIPTVRGNHDAPTRDMPDANATYLRGLPDAWQDTLHDVRLYMCHGIPGVNFIGFTPKSLAKTGLQEMVINLNVDIVIAGHTHQVLCQQVGSTWIVNPGSVYAQSEEGTSHTYGVLDLDTRVLTVFDHLLPTDHTPILQTSLA